MKPINILCLALFIIVLALSFLSIKNAKHIDNLCKQYPTDNVCINLANTTPL